MVHSCFSVQLNVYIVIGLFVVFLAMAEVSRIPICVKDFVIYETGKWKCLEPFLFFIKCSANYTLVVNKWIHRYRAAVVNLQAMNEEICCSVDSCLLKRHCS